MSDFSLRENIAEIKMLISYKIIIGTASNICDVGSGGVNIAPTIKAPTMAYLRYLRMNCGVRIPIFESIRLSIGSSKTTPKTNMSRIKKPM